MVDTNEKGPAERGTGRGGRYDRPIFGAVGKVRRSGSEGPTSGRKGRASTGKGLASSGEALISGGKSVTSGGKALTSGGKTVTSDRGPGPGTGASASSRMVLVPGRRRIGLQVQFLLFSLLALAIVGGVAWFYLRPAETVFVLDSYQFTHVQERDFRDLIVSGGTVEPEQVAVFAAPSAARVRDVFVEPGQDVDAGVPLLQLVSDDLTEELDKAVAALDEARLDLEQARLRTEADVLAKERDVHDAERALAEAEAALPLTKHLFELGGVSAREMEEAEAEVERRRLQVDNAGQALALAQSQAELTLRQAEQKARAAERSVAKLQEQLDEMTVRADVAGRVLSVSVRQGEHVAAGKELLRHADVARQEVVTAVTPDQAARLELGTPGVVRIGGRTMSAAVRFVAPLAQSGTDRSAVPVTLALDAEDAASLRPFTEVSVEMELGVRRGRPALTRGPFFASGDTSFVYVVTEDGQRAERREVRYGAIDGNFVEVVAGLEPGDEIVYSSYTAFRTHGTVELIREGGRPVE